MNSILKPNPIPKLNSSGQGEMVFRMLIGVVMGLTILVTIVSMIHYFSQQEINVSEQRLYEGFQTALENLTTSESSDVVTVEDLKLREGVYSAHAFAAKTGLSAECVEMQGSNAFNPTGIGGKVELPHLVKTTVYYKCIPQYSDCEVYCTVSFGKKIS